MLKLLLKFLGFAALCSTVFWVYKEPEKYDSWVAAAASLVVFLGLFIGDAIKRPEKQVQHVGDGSTGVQAGGNVNINVSRAKGDE